ncbi:DUF4180 domain-containing protein [Clostridium sp. MSJ-11]|uniref:DUF4180 domain-containing protein n=1 Tax=Clostridium mobile TaxID=2841512 RepID=A0ABS6EFH8_9CLOT|nr:DUF4180 domain-containing protein [Clostridium mobile]MBU5483961.1 DUF4180 domain-containing protein [Clostridium mobile]
MNYKVIKKYNKKYIECISLEKQISSEQDILDIISICMENDVNIIIFYDNAFSESFFNLRTGLAGIMLQKFINYNIKLGIVLDEEKVKGRFKEMIIEANNGNQFRTFKSIEDAEIWISKL